MQNAISIAQIVISVALIVLILIQQRDSDLSGFMGGSSGGGSGFYQQRRGLERFLFVVTIILIIAFAALALTNLFYHGTNAELSDAQTTNATSTTSLASSTQGAPIKIVAPTSTTK